MFRNFVLMAWRNLRREKISTVLNITGLALGMATALLIMLWVNDELSYDKFNLNYDRIHRVVGRFELNGEKYEHPNAPPAMAEVMLKEFPGVELACRFRDFGSVVMTIGDKTFSEPSIIYTDSTLTQLFTIATIKGDPVKALSEPNTLVITQKAATRYFGTGEPIGREISVDGKSMVVGAVIADIPENSHFKHQVFASLEGTEESKSKNFLSDNFYTYILLSPGTTPDEINNRFPAFIVKYLGPDIEKLLGKTLDEFMKNASATYELQSLADIHLYSNFKQEMGQNGNASQVWFFSFIAIFILVIACINFMNMATASAERRAKEVGIRKATGAIRWQIMAQYLTESALIAIIAHVVAMILVELWLPWFNVLADKNIELHYLSAQTLAAIAGLILLTTLLAGIYPAFYLSGLKPIDVLKGGMGTARGKGRLRNVLVVFQFATTIVLLSGTIIIYLQLNFINKKDVGYSRENLLMVYNTGYLEDKVALLKEELLQHHEITGATVSSFLPVPSTRNNSAVFPDDNRDATISLQQWRIDYDYLSTMNIKLIMGRNFSREYGTDTATVIINEAAAKHFGWTDPLNHYISNYHWNAETKETWAVKFRVIGVVKDFHFESLHEQVRPLVFFLNKGKGWILTCKLQPGTTDKVLKLLEEKWKSYSTGEPFEYAFVDQQFNAVYKREKRMGKIVTAFSLLAIAIASIGIYGLATYAMRRRTKEIGIRKVNGATEWQIVFMLTRHFSCLVAIAFVLSVPPAWYILDQWLNQFAFRVGLNIWMFLIAGLVAFFIAFATTLGHSYFAATRNPVDALKYE
ncbi:MAG: ABC transporter permease [Bacteroidales bacterium]|nr:ABC transporter permease [Bacteroidales bacterium]